MLPRDHGLLFVYDQDADTRTFVMRGMRYPIDIVLIDGTGTVTAVHSAVPEPGTAGGELTRYTGLGDDVGRKSRTHPPTTQKL